jgi:quinol monooxygenase YgiN
MAVRLVLQFTAAPGKGAELAAAFKGRCEEVASEPGCLQFEIFQSALDPDKLTLLELWQDDAALAEHAKMNTTRAPFPPGLMGGRPTREDYVHTPKG